MSLGKNLVSSLEYFAKEFGAHAIAGLLVAAVLLAVGLPQNIGEKFFDWFGSLAPTQYRTALILLGFGVLILICKIVVKAVTKYAIDREKRKNTNSMDKIN